MDLFYSGLTVQQQLKKLKKDIKVRLGADFKYKRGNTSKFLLMQGNMESFNNCIMILLPHVTTRGFMNSSGEKYLQKIIEQYGFKNYIISYCYLDRAKSVTRPMIKENIKDVETLISIVGPSMIVMAGVDGCDVFLTRKPLVEDKHGTVVGEHCGAELILTHHPSYFVTDSGYEDKRYKEHIQKQDWDLIKSKYDKLIVEEQ